jgi:hypothetical protein
MSKARKRRRQKLKEHPPDQPIVAHRWPDGWTLENIWRYEDAERDGRLVGHCLATEMLGLEVKLARPFWCLMSLRDPDGYPRVTAYVDLSGEKPEIVHSHSLGFGSGIAPAYRERMEEVPSLPLDAARLRELEYEPDIDPFLFAAQDFLSD